MAVNFARYLIQLIWYLNPYCLFFFVDLFFLIDFLHEVALNTAAMIFESILFKYFTSLRTSFSWPMILLVFYGNGSSWMTYIRASWIAIDIAPRMAFCFPLAFSNMIIFAFIPQYYSITFASQVCIHQYNARENYDQHMLNHCCN